MKNLPNTRFRPLALVATLLAGTAVATGAQAQVSSPADLRGYTTCINAMDTGDLTGVHFPRVYYIAKSADSKTYYVNATGWQNGVRVAKRLTCETNNSGREILAANVVDGRYALASRERLEVAER